MAAIGTDSAKLWRRRRRRKEEEEEAAAAKQFAKLEAVVVVDIVLLES